MVVLWLSVLFLFKTVFVTPAAMRQGRLLQWKNAKLMFPKIRAEGIRQFADRYHALKCVSTPIPKWGDEIEYSIFKFNKNIGTYDTFHDTSNILKLLQDRDSSTAKWQPEYGSWMLEGTPASPYKGDISSIIEVEKNMKNRRLLIHNHLSEGEIAPSLSVFPMLGVPGFDLTNNALDTTASKYSMLSERSINPLPRYLSLTQNIADRRGAKVDINIQTSTNDNIVLDSVSFGMGSCCIQTTVQFRNERESRFMYDQLGVVAPYFLSLSASTPFQNGHLTELDCRWSTISQSVDDRTPFERGNTTLIMPDDENLVGMGKRRISKSRYSSISRYLGKCFSVSELQNMKDLHDPNAFDEEVYGWCIQHGFDEILAAHIAYLYIRDPLVVLDTTLGEQDPFNMSLFDNIQSTNWLTVRWKIPEVRVDTQVNEDSSDVETGWRVEFRPMELQLSDFENAAYSVVVYLLSRAILASDLNLYLPISMVDENMIRAENQDALLKQKFFIRRQPSPKIYSISEKDHGSNAFKCRNEQHEIVVPSLSKEHDIIELSMKDIFLGSKGQFVGFLPLIRKYLEVEMKNITPEAYSKIEEYLQYMEKKVTGVIPSTARYLRNFVENYESRAQKDSKISVSCARDLMLLCEAIGMEKNQLK